MPRNNEHYTLDLLMFPAGMIVKRHLSATCQEPDFNASCNNYFVASSMEELFRSVDVCNVLDYIGEIHLCNKL